MADSRRYPLGNQLDIQQILVEAQNRWLRPAEIVEILSNYQRFRIAPEPAHMPPSGSLFLFDRKVLRYFRKDGHNWRKKKDGKTVKEAHERLKSGSVDVLHCYYAHGEDNENFQRRSYWMLEEELSHIVLVHYREVKGTRTNFNRIKAYEEPIPYSQETEDMMPNSEMDTSVSSSFRSNGYQVPTGTTDSTSMNSALASEYEDAESGYNNQASSRFNSFLEVQRPAMEKMDTGTSIPYDHMPFSSGYQGKMPAVPVMEFISPAQVDTAKDTIGTEPASEPQKVFDLPSWEDVLENCSRGIESVPFQTTLLSQVDTVGVIPKQEDILEKFLANSFDRSQDIGSHLLDQEAWQTIEGGYSHRPKWSLDQKLHLDSDLTARFHDQQLDSGNFINTFEPFCAQENDNHIQNDLQIQPANSDHGMTLEGKSIYSTSMKQHILDDSRTEGLKKLDSFTRWMSKELEDVDQPHLQSSSGTYWISAESENVVDADNPSHGHLDTYTLGPSLSQDQLFSIIDFSPNWAYAATEIKVLVMGRFLKSREEAENFKWSIMFGEVEVPAEIIADGILRCTTPSHKAGRVPFYVTCSNRVACSEVREFEYRLSHVQDITYNYINIATEDLHMRLAKLLSLSSAFPSKYDSSDVDEISQLSNKISSLLKEGNETWDQMLKLTSLEGFSSEKLKDQLLQKALKEQLHEWLLQKVAEGGKGPSVLDEGGQGVLHFAAALGYEWALEPTIVAGVSVNFRDVNGWTALHWAASYGRERTVASLIHLGAAPGALTDPTPKYPTGRTPADLASANGHKGISGFLAESALSAHLSSLNLEKQDGDAAESSGIPASLTVSDCNETPVKDADIPIGLSLKDSLAAVCNATQAAARIHQVFRVQSFQKKQLKEYGDDKFGMSHERALSLIAVKSQKAGQYDEPVHAAIRIQNKFRGWKGRKEFLIIRQRIVKIQAHVRGHQVRKNYRKIIWSVGILDKIILRWRRKGSGLRGFKSEALTEGSSMQVVSSKDDDDDFLKEGRKQTEERSQIALARVKSMHQHPEAREQYHRLRNVVAEIQETKAMYEWANNSEAMVEFDDLINLETLWDGDTFLPTDS